MISGNSRVSGASCGCLRSERDGLPEAILPEQRGEQFDDLADDGYEGHPRLPSEAGRGHAAGAPHEMAAAAPASLERTAHDAAAPMGWLPNLCIPSSAT